MSPLTIYALQDMGNATQDDWAESYEQALEVRTDNLFTYQEILALPFYRRIWHTRRMIKLVYDLRYEQLFLNDCRKTINWSRVHRDGSYRICFQLERLERKLIASLQLSNLLSGNV